MKAVLQILLERSENNAHFSVEGYGPGVVQTGKRREDRAAVLVTTRLSRNRIAQGANAISNSEIVHSLQRRVKRQRTGQEKAERPK